ncbi:MAG: DUF1579 family protein [Planctomycetota bacterium]
MTTRTQRVLAAAVMCYSVAFATAFADDAPRGPGRLTHDVLLEQAKPGSEHQDLARRVGSWKVTVTMGEGDRAATSNGRVKAHMLMDDRFLWIAYNTAGRAGSLKGAFMIGFDRRNSRYTIMGIDTHGTYAVTSQGNKDPQTGTIKLYGKDDDPNMKAMGFDKEFAHVLDFRSPDEFAIEVRYIDTRTPERREMKAMAFVFERNK